MDLSLKLNNSIELTVIILLLIALLFNGTIMEEVIPPNLVIRYNSKIWHILILLIVVAAALWSPYIGVLCILLYVMYVHDMEMLTKPLKV